MAFNIVLHVIFAKLFFELNTIPVFALNLVILTIGLNYVIFALFSSSSIGEMIDWNLVNVATRSVFQLNSFVLLITTCMLIVFMEHMVYMSSNMECRHLFFCCASEKKSTVNTYHIKSLNKLKLSKKTSSNGKTSLKSKNSNNNPYRS